MPERTLDNESRYTLQRSLVDDPELSVRDLAKEPGISLGKTNYCLKALLDKGYIKAGTTRTARTRAPICSRRPYVHHVY